jgi:hypothetical protein
MLIVLVDCETASTIAGLEWSQRGAAAGRYDSTKLGAVLEALVAQCSAMRTAIVAAEDPFEWRSEARGRATSRDSVRGFFRTTSSSALWSCTSAPASR